MEKKMVKKKEKTEKFQKMTVEGNEIRSDVDDFRKSYLKKGFELVDITELCKFKLGHSGWCNELNQPDDKIYHIQIMYRNENIGVFTGDGCYVINDKKYIIFVTDKDDEMTGANFTVFKMCPNKDA